VGFRQNARLLRQPYHLQAHVGISSVAMWSAL
jgi:hypothetical protein